MTAIVVRPITAAEHRDFIAAQPAASFLQTPAWAQVKPEWKSLSVGWFAAGELAGVALVLLRPVPVLKTKFLAYLPEGPVLAWDRLEPATALPPLTQFLKTQGAFAVRLGPALPTRSWDDEAVKAAIADETTQSLTQVPATHTHPLGVTWQRELARLGWTPLAGVGGFTAGQPQYNFQLHLGDKTHDELLAGMNQQWRRNIRKADREGVTITHHDGADPNLAPHLAAFHDLYVHTAQRDQFTPRPLSYFTTMMAALSSEAPDRIRLYLAHHEDDLVAATIWIKVGTHVWYAYGASSTAKRNVQGSNAIQWAMMADAADLGATIYDQRGISDVVAAGDPLLGLLRFKVGTGGDAVEYVGEWDWPINRLLYRAFTWYMARR